MSRRSRRADARVIHRCWRRFARLLALASARPRLLGCARAAARAVRARLLASFARLPRRSRAARASFGCSRHSRCSLIRALASFACLVIRAARVMRAASRHSPCSRHSRCSRHSPASRRGERGTRARAADRAIRAAARRHSPLLARGERVHARSPAARCGRPSLEVRGTDAQLCTLPLPRSPCIHDNCGIYRARSAHRPRAMRAFDAFAVAPTPRLATPPDTHTRRIITSPRPLARRSPPPSLTSPARHRRWLAARPLSRGSPRPLARRSPLATTLATPVSPPARHARWLATRHACWLAARRSTTPADSPLATRLAARRSPLATRARLASVLEPLAARHASSLPLAASPRVLVPCSTVPRCRSPLDHRSAAHALATPLPRRRPRPRRSPTRPTRAVAGRRAVAAVGRRRRVRARSPRSAARRRYPSGSRGRGSAIDRGRRFHGRRCRVAARSASASRGARAVDPVPVKW